MILGGLLGDLGGLEQVMFTSKEAVAFGSRTVKRRAGSGRMHVDVRPRAERVWSCSIDVDAPQEGYILDELQERQWRTGGTLIWYPADSQGTNMLTPEASQMDTAVWTDLTESGPRAIKPAYAGDRPVQHPPWAPPAEPRFLLSGSTDVGGAWAHLSMIPVPHQRTVTASVLITRTPGETGYFYVDELAADGTTLEVHEAYTNALGPTRLAHTFTTRFETVALTFGVSRAVRVAHPALTLTDHVMPWGIGRGCTAALLEITSRDPLWTGRDQPIYAAADKTEFTITEILP